jgi:hypothetical protein
VDHNHYLNTWQDAGLYPKTESDHVGGVNFLSFEAGERDYLRIKGRDSTAPAESDGEQNYVGAFPPGPVVNGGDWFTRLQRQWRDTDLKSASNSPTPVHRRPNAEKPFVIIRSGGKERKEFKRFAEAIATLRAGDGIEVHGNGPFSVPAVRLEGKGLVIRAAESYRPVFVASKSAAEHYAWFEVQGGPLTLEGCDFHAGVQTVAFVGGGGDWIWQNCRFLVGPGGLLEATGPRLTICDSLIWSGGVAIRAKSHTDVELTNNVIRSGR